MAKTSQRTKAMNKAKIKIAKEFLEDVRVIKAIVDAGFTLTNKKKADDLHYQFEIEGIDVPKNVEFVDLWVTTTGNEILTVTCKPVPP